MGSSRRGILTDARSHDPRMGANERGLDTAEKRARDAVTAKAAREDVAAQLRLAPAGPSTWGPCEA
jgi:hypothetical protein